MLQDVKDLERSRIYNFKHSNMKLKKNWYGIEY